MSDMTTVDTDTTSTITIQSPENGTLLGKLDCAVPATVDQALAAAVGAQPEWEATPVTERARLLHLIADELSAAAEELARLNHKETGKTLPDARGGVTAAIGTVRQYAELGPVHRGYGLRGDRLAADYTRRRAHGVTAVITPWNDPVAITMGLAAAALVSGNTVVHKPSERCPHLGSRLGRLCASVLPPGVITTLVGGPEIGRMLSAEPRIALCAHVGSSSAGLDIHVRAAGHGAHVIRENGGNDPLLIDSGVDPRYAAQQAALGSFANAGQICTSVERIYVHQNLAEAFVDALIEAATGYDRETSQPLVDRRHRDTVHGFVHDSVRRGARPRAGAEIPDGPGAHYPATVLDECRPGMAVLDEEVFGPVAPVCVVENFNEGLDLACSGRFGLAATVLSADLDHIGEAIDRLPVGTVKINEVFGGAPGGSAQPRGASGSGFGFGPELLDEMSTTSVVHIASVKGVKR